MGLGSDYARLCAESGMDVVVVARSREKLEALGEALAKKHGITAHVVAVDLGRREAAAEIEAEVTRLGLTIDVLINNAGFGNTGAFVQAELEKELSMIHVNVESLVALTHRFSRGMVSRGSGRILLIGSTAGFQPAPGMAVYCATKAFVVSFGAALAYELRGTGVTVTTHCPGATATEFAQTAGNADTPIFKAGALVSTSAACAEDGFADMNRGRGLTIHGFMNWISATFAPMLPLRFILALAGGLLGWKPLGKAPRVAA